MRKNLASLLLLPLVSAVSTSCTLVPHGGATDIADGHMTADLSAGLERKIKGGSESYFERIVQSQWEKHRRWSLVYKTRKKNLTRARIAKLTLMSMGAVAQAAATQVPAQYRTTASFLGGILLGTSSYIKSNYLTDDKVEYMVTSFYISQAIQSEVCKYRAQVRPYGRSNGRSKISDDEALQKLRDRCILVSSNGDDKMFYIIHKDAKRVPNTMNTRYDYIEHRINPMINNFYMEKARSMDKRGKLLSNVEDTLLMFGTLFGVGATQNLPVVVQKLSDRLAGWTGAFTTISAAFANHHAKSKYEEAAQQFYGAAETLRGLRDAWPLSVGKAGDPGWDEQILKCEDLILSTSEDFARVKTGIEELSFVTPKMSSASQKGADKKWNPNVICGTDESGIYAASERVKWLVKNEDMAIGDAQKRVMKEFPENFN